MSGVKDQSSGDNDEVDVVLVIGKTRLYCNRHRLATKSPYFAAMFQSEMIESRSGIVQLHGVCPSAMDALMLYMNTGHVVVQLEAVPRLLEAATMFQFDAVVAICVERLADNLGTSNCLGIMNLADRLSLTDLHLQAKQVSMWYFVQVAQEAEILDVPLQCLVDYLSHDALRVQSEMQIFQVVTRWIKRDKRNRLTHLEELISAVRFSDMSLKEIRTVTVNEIVKECPFVRAIVREIWMIRLNEQSEGRLSSGSSQTATPLSNVSPAESVADLVVNVAAAHAGSNEGETLSCEKSKPSSSVMDLIKVELCKEKVMAQRFLMSKRRCIPTVPAVVRFNDDKKRLPELIYFDPHDRRTKTITSMTKVYQKNYPALGFKVCAVGNFVVVIGGEFMYGRNNWNMSAWKYNIFSKTWSLLGNLHSPRRHHTLCTLNDFIYIIGGIGRFRVAIGTVEKICLTTGNLSDVASMPNPVYSAMSTSYEGKIYVLDTNVYRYDPCADAWTHLKSLRLPHELQLHSALAHPNGIYLVGTYPAKIILLNVSYSKTADDVSNAPYKTIGQLCHISTNACIANDKIYSFGGCLANGLVIESYDLATDTVNVEYNGGKTVDANSNGSSDQVTVDILRSTALACEMVGNTTVHYGCFALPKYFV